MAGRAGQGQHTKGSVRECRADVNGTRDRERMTALLSVTRQHPQGLLNYERLPSTKWSQVAESVVLVSVFHNFSPLLPRFLSTVTSDYCEYAEENILTSLAASSLLIIFITISSNALTF